jgi:hypothetical protein
MRPELRFFYAAQTLQTKTKQERRGRIISSKDVPPELLL